MLVSSPPKDRNVLDAERTTIIVQAMVYLFLTGLRDRDAMYGNPLCSIRSRANSSPGSS